MLDVVQFIGGRYGIRNSMTGIILHKNNGAPRMYRTVGGAKRARKRISRRLNKTMYSLAKNY